MGFNKYWLIFCLLLGNFELDICVIFSIFQCYCIYIFILKYKCICQLLLHPPKNSKRNQHLSYMWEPNAWAAAVAVDFNHICTLSFKSKILISVVCLLELHEPASIGGVNMLILFCCILCSHALLFLNSTLNVNLAMILNQTLSE